MTRDPVKYPEIQARRNLERQRLDALGSISDDKLAERLRLYRDAVRVLELARSRVAAAETPDAVRDARAACKPLEAEVKRWQKVLGIVVPVAGA